LFFGALGDFPPTDSQAQVIYSSIKNTIVAAQGPPGSGKTTLIVNIVANQVVKSALSLIEGKDQNCLTVITSTNNRAVANAIEKIAELDKEQSEWDLCLDGGNREKINQHAIKAIDKKIEFLKTQDFDEEKYERLKDEITCNYREIQAKINEFYDLIDKIKKIEGDIAENKNLFDKQKEKVDRTRLKLENDIKDFFGQKSSVGCSDLNDISGDTYYKIKDLLIKYHSSFPRFFDFFGWRSRRHLNKLNVEIEPLLERTYNNPPGLRMSLVEDKAALIRLKDKADRICLLIDAQREFMAMSKQLDNMKSKLHNLDKQLSNKKQEVRGWLKKITSGKLSEEKIDSYFAKITFERNDIFKLYHEIFFNENLKLFRLCKCFLLQHVLKNKNAYIDTLEKYVKLISRKEDNNDVFNEVLIDVEGFYRNLSKVFPVFGSTSQSVSNMFKHTTPNPIRFCVILLFLMCVYILIF
jgi:RecA/RadA recombinase